MNKMLLLTPLLALVACAPAQGQKPRVYAANSAEILTAISQLAPSIQPLGGFNYFSVIESTPTQVTVRSDGTVGMQLLGVSGPIVVTFTALQSGNSTSVSHFGKLGAGAISPSSTLGQNIENIYKQLDMKFQRVQ